MKYFIYLIGSQKILESFFSTISHQLEHDLWGSKYPYLQNKFFKGELSYEDIASAKAELRDIHYEFAKNDSSYAVGYSHSTDTKSLADYFLTSDNGNLFELIFKVFDNGLRLKENIIIEEDSLMSLPGHRTIAVLRKDVIGNWGEITPEFANTEEKVLVHVFNNNLEDETNVSRSIRFAAGRIEWFKNNQSKEYRHEIAFDDRGQTIDDSVRNRIIDGLSTYASIHFMSKER